MAGNQNSGARSDYSAAEDAILMATQYTSAAETNRQLREAGFRERTPGSIRNRRYRLAAGGYPMTPRTILLRERAKQQAACHRLETMLRTAWDSLAATEKRLAELDERGEGG